MITAELMKKIRRIEIRTRRLVNDSFAGDYQSVFKGLGMEFDEVRPYTIGDDVRSIDWNVTARMGTPYIKRYVEERELTVMLVVDASGSGDFGSAGQFKRELAAELAAVLSFAATTNNDKVGLLVFTDRIELHIPPRKGRRHVLRLIRELLAFEPAGRGTDTKLALDTVNQIMKRAGIVFLISDFLDAPASYSQALSMANRKHDVVAIELRDPLEREMQPAGLLLLEDAETGVLKWVDTGSAAWRRQFEQRAGQREALKTRIFRQAAIDCIQIDTGQDYVSALTKFFQVRSKRMGKRVAPRR